jgi:hypothetical protein
MFSTIFAAKFLPFLGTTFLQLFLQNILRLFTTDVTFFPSIGVAVSRQIGRRKTSRWGASNLQVSWAFLGEEGSVANARERVVNDPLKLRFVDGFCLPVKRHYFSTIAPVLAPGGPEFGPRNSFGFRDLG